MVVQGTEFLSIQFNIRGDVFDSSQIAENVFNILALRVNFNIYKYFFFFHRSIYDPKTCNEPLADIILAKTIILIVETDKYAWAMIIFLWPFVVCARRNNEFQNHLPHTKLFLGLDPPPLPTLTFVVALHSNQYIRVFNIR